MFLVTGASGRTGGQVARQLLDRGHAVRAFVRHPDSAPDGAEVAVGDYAHPDTIAAALDDVQGVFLLWSTGHDRTAAEVVDILGRVDHVVYLSARGAEPSGENDDELGPILASHRRLERLLTASPTTASFVRGGGFASNTLGWASDIRSNGRVRAPFGGIPRALVHERDLAEVAVIALTQKPPTNQTYTITGPETLTGEEQVRAIGAAIGRDLQLESLDRRAAIAQLIQQGADDVAATSMVMHWQAMVNDPEQPTPDFTRTHRSSGDSVHPMGPRPRR